MNIDGTSLLNCVPCVPACQRGLRVNVLACQRGLRVNVPAYQHGNKIANVSTWHVNVPNGVPTFQFGLPTYAKLCQFFKHFSYEMLGGISTLYYFIKKATLYLISQFYISHFIILCFYTSCHNKEKCVEFFFFLFYFFAF